MRSAPRGLTGWSYQVLAFLALLIFSESASAQNTKQPSWEIDVSGGVNGSQGGALTSSGATLADGPSFTTPGSSAQIDRSISSWFISPSSTFLMPSIPSLAQTVHAPGVSGRNRGVIAGHGTYWMNDHVGIEVAGSYGPGAPTELDAATISAINQSRTAFVNAFTTLFSAGSGVYVGSHADATIETANGSGGQILVTAAVVWSPLSGRSRPYAVIGGGERSVLGSDQTVSIRGSYSFTTSGGVPIAQADSVTLTYTGGHSLVSMFGGGLRQYFTAQSGLRVDARAMLGHKSDEVTLDVAPSSQAGTPAGFFVQNPPLSNGTIVFSNTPSQQSTLGGPPSTNLTTAMGAGWRWTWEITIGWFWRF